MHNTLLAEYDYILIGRKKEFDLNEFDTSLPGGINERKALSCIRYAIETILKWTPKEALLRFDEYVIREMKLEKITGFIFYPADVLERDPRYILSLLYPDTIQAERSRSVERIYEEVLNSGRKKGLLEEGCGTEHARQFPRDYFSGTDGFERFCLCIRYLFENYRPVESIPEMYEFLCSPKGNRFLSDFRLLIPASQFSIDLLRVIYHLTQNEPDSDLYYSYYSFKKEYEKSRA